MIGIQILTSIFGGMEDLDTIVVSARMVS